jgi:hypothetical protein
VKQSVADVGVQIASGMGAWDWLDVEAVAAKKGNDGRCEGGERGSGHSEEAGARTHTRTQRERADQA